MDGKIGGWISGNITLMCDNSKISCLTGNQRWTGASTNHFPFGSFIVNHSITVSDLVRFHQVGKAIKACPEYSSKKGTRVGKEFGKGAIMEADLVQMRRCTRQNSTSETSMRRS